jgi:site-specific recombinase XerD
MQAVEMSRDGISPLVIQRQLEHADLATTSRYPRGIDSRAPMIPADPRLVPRR